ncbi:hypothetical protein C8Q76DRAFT_852572 [Earliella scabrosa]|nr:hypothetical protein C8Q76DRAFT_852572 [Earliella scabrosa]
MPVVPSQVTLGNGPPPSVSPAHQRILVPQHIWGNHPGQPSFPTYCIPTIWFTKPDAPGIPLRELLDSPKDILRSRIPGYRDQRILEVLHSHIRLIISWSGYEGHRFAREIYLSEEGAGGVSCHGELAVEIARAYQLFLERAPTMNPPGQDPPWRVTHNSVFTLDNLALVSANHLSGDRFLADVEIVRRPGVPYVPSAPLQASVPAARATTAPTSAPQAVHPQAPQYATGPPPQLRAPGTLQPDKENHPACSLLPTRPLHVMPLSPSNPPRQSPIPPHANVPVSYTYPMVPPPMSAPSSSSAPPKNDAHQGVVASKGKGKAASSKSGRTRPRTAVEVRAARRRQVAPAQMPAPAAFVNFSAATFQPPQGPTPSTSQSSSSQPPTQQGGGDPATTQPPAQAEDPMWKMFNLTKEQEDALVTAFVENTHLLSPRADWLAEVTGLPVDVVKEWFVQARAQSRYGTRFSHWTKLQPGGTKTS